MQAILTRWTQDSNGNSWINASCQACRKRTPWDLALNIDENHAAAAKALAVALDWSGDWTSGGLPDGSVAWVCQRKGGPLPGEVFSVVRSSKAA